MKAMEKRHKEEMERMHGIQLQHRLAEQKQASERAVGTAVMQLVVSPLFTFPLQSSRCVGTMPLSAMLSGLHGSWSQGHFLGPGISAAAPGQQG